jgi:hypothetical protein
MPVIFFRPQTLESIARKALSEYDTAYLGRPPGPVPIEIIIEKVYGLSIEYKYLTNNGRELGRMIYDDGITTYFDKDINDCLCQHKSLAFGPRKVVHLPRPERF